MKNTLFRLGKKEQYQDHQKTPLPHLIPSFITAWGRRHWMLS
jgi:hypothetical protein